MKLLTVLSWIVAIVSILFLIAFLSTHNEQKPTPLQQSTQPSITLEMSIESLLKEHNRIRRENNLTELSLNDSLNRSAQRKAEIMLESNCWSHNCPVAPWYLFIEEGYGAQVEDSKDKMGENLSKGLLTVDSAMKAWMKSPTHKKNILNERYRDIGFGFAKGNYQGYEDNLIIVAHFGVHN